MKIFKNTNLSFASSKYPYFIRSHPKLGKANSPQIKKIFPLIGLPNVQLKDEEYSPIKDNYWFTFSSDPWDIATMSQRGIESCQHWPESLLEQEVKQASKGIKDPYYKDTMDEYEEEIIHCQKLVGSILDPCCAVIYLTISHNAPNHSRCEMHYRSVVRLVKEKSTHQYGLLLDTLYNEYGNCTRERDHDNDTDTEYLLMELGMRKVLELFNTQLKIPLKIFSNQSRIHDKEFLRILQIPQGKSISNLDSKFVSYRDTSIKYVKLNKSNKSKLPTNARSLLV